MFDAAISTKAHAEILGLVSLPAYSGAEQLHKEIARVSWECHLVAEIGGKQLGDAEQALDELVAELWGVGAPDIERAQRMLETQRV